MKKTINTDLMIAGGGIAGMCAAISAARLGLKVVLINDRSVLGGNASSEIGVGISGSCHHGLNPAIYAKETGIVEEIKQRLGYYKICDGYGKYAVLDAVFFDMIYAEENITLLMNTVVEGCEVKDKKITKAYARHSVNNNEYEISAQSFVDATGNGTLALEAGAEYKVGREGKDEYNEKWAPDKADKLTMGNSIYFETEDAGCEVEFIPPEYAHDISKMEFLKDIDKPENFRGFSCFGPHWAYEFGGQIDIINDHDETEKELRKLIYGIWDYVKNSGKYPKAKNRRLKRVYAKAGTRESRRFIGDYMMNENDVENKVDFYDSVAIGGWPMDIHAPLGIYDKLPASNFVSVTGTYNIPFRCLYTKDVDNLMLAGRNISVSHIVLGSTRVMSTCGEMGQVVGTAAYLMKKHNETPRELLKNHIEDLQKLLIENDQTIIHRKEDIEEFEIKASSTKAYENTRCDGFMELERDYCLCLPIDSDILNSFKVKLSVKKDTVLKYKILKGTHKETYLPDRVVKTIEKELCKMEDEWVTIDVNEEKGEDEKLFIVFEENKDIQIGISDERSLGAITMRMHKEGNCEGKNHDSVPIYTIDEYDFFDHTYETNRNILFCDVVPKQNVYSPKNVFNGYNRPYGVMNIWMADSERNEWLEVDVNKDVNTLKIILNNDLDDDWVNISKCIAKNMQITICYENDKTKTIDVTNNFKRMLKFDVNLKNVSKIKIKINETYGGKASVYGVKIS